MSNTITNKGLIRLKEEYEYLVTVKRKEVADKIKQARSFGDLSENSEYDEAKNEQGILEGRISELEETIKNAVILDRSELKSDTVSVGTTVVLMDIKTNKDYKYTIVGTNESDVLKRLLSDESPVGKALLGKKLNDEVQIKMPNGMITEYKITSIEVSE